MLKVSSRSFLVPCDGPLVHEGPSTETSDCSKVCSWTAVVHQEELWLLAISVIIFLSFCSVACLRLWHTLTSSYNTHSPYFSSLFLPCLIHREGWTSSAFHWQKINSWCMQSVCHLLQLAKKETRMHSFKYLIFYVPKLCMWLFLTWFPRERCSCNHISLTTHC